MYRTMVMFCSLSHGTMLSGIHVSLHVHVRHLPAQVGMAVMYCANRYSIVVISSEGQLVERLSVLSLSDGCRGLVPVVKSERGLVEADMKPTEHRKR
jgi:hypothetical protein